MIQNALLEVWFDGCCEPTNPFGHGGAGVVVRVNDRPEYAEAIYVGHGPTMSNNVAEYRGVIAALEHILSAGLAEMARTIRIYGDSRLVIHQLRREWGVNAGLYVPHYERARALLADVRRRCPGTIELRWIPRDANNEADALSRQPLAARGITPRRRTARRPETGAA